MYNDFLVFLVASLELKREKNDLMTLRSQSNDVKVTKLEMQIYFSDSFLFNISNDNPLFFFFYQLLPYRIRHGKL
jgi:hypothetical protein